MNIEKIERSRSSTADQNDYEYWNDASEERGKLFDTTKYSLKDLTASEKYSELVEHAEHLLSGRLKQLTKAKIVSIGSGTCWLETLLFNKPNIEELICCDISRHRIFDLSVANFEEQKFRPKVKLVNGYFDEDVLYESADLYFFSQSFHHLPSPELVLEIIRKAGSEGAMIAIVGEHHFSMYRCLSRALIHFGKYLVNHNKIRARSSLIPTYSDLFFADESKGDKHYCYKDYLAFFEGSSIRLIGSDVSKNGRYKGFLGYIEDKNCGFL